ncbi:MAG: PhoX family phosphatase [Ornithinimicrobium sp.]
MTISTPPRRSRLLPLAMTPRSGGRSAMTCHYRCGDACAQAVPNTSDNEYFGDVVARGLSRRHMVKAGAVGGVLGGLSAWSVINAEQSGATEVAAHGRHGHHRGDFRPIASTPADVDDVVVPDGFTWKPIISWGDPITAGAPEFDFDNQSVEAQQQQAGYNCDYTTLLVDGRRGYHKNRGLLVFNNEYTNDELMFRDISGPEDLSDEQIEIIMSAHGMTVVEVTRRHRKSAWTYRQDGRRNRRIHAWTEFSVDGPAAGAPALQTSADPAGTTVLGTLNNCSGGDTPWGTVLSGEENFNQYFDATGAADPDGALARYGITSSGRGWERVDQRFSVAQEPNEVNRFGWVIEVDPQHPESAPVKHTAMGRFKHEGANVRLSHDGHAVAYMGDDERFDYVYKFVSKQTYRRHDHAHNMTLLAEGDLYVAKFVGDGFEDGVSDGTGTWLPLVLDGDSQVEGFSVEDVLVHTRLAADKVGPTKMDRPEDVQPDPKTGRVYVALTNNTDRTPAQIDEPNPRATNKYGQVLELRERRDDPTSTRFRWKLVLIAGDPDDPTTYFNGYDKSEVSPISCPDNVAFDAAGDLWIATDGMPGTLEACDGLFLMPLRGREQGHVQQFLSVPRGAECCGPVVSLEDNTVLVAVQHPGEVDGAGPGNVASLFPYLGDGQPRPGIVHVFRPNGSGRS